MSDNKTIGQVDGGGLAKKKMIVEIGAEAASWTVDDVKSRLAETGLEVQRTFGTPATQFTVSAIGLEERSHSFSFFFLAFTLIALQLCGCWQARVCQEHAPTWYRGRNSVFAVGHLGIVPVGVFVVGNSFFGQRLRFSLRQSVGQ